MFDAAGRSGLDRPLLRFLAAATTLILLGLAPAALAHAERSGSSPEPQERLEEAPEQITIEFTEPPTGDATARVTDGCERDLVRSVDVSDRNMTITLGSGQPGGWTVETQVVSAVDGHTTRDSWRFRVRGEADCDQAVEDPDETDVIVEEPPDGGGPPWIPIALGVGALLLIAAAVRAGSSQK